MFSNMFVCPQRAALYHITPSPGAEPLSWKGHGTRQEVTSYRSGTEKRALRILLECFLVVCI